MPFALHIESPSKNYDTGGMSVEGAIPRDGHLGAIVYGESAENHIRVEGDANLFATFHQMDPGWAVGEFNTADFRKPNELPTYAMGYRVLREMFNYGARFASPVAWNGSNGAFAGQPGYVSFTAWRNTSTEDAMRDFAIAHAFVPLGTRLWTFGSARDPDTDDWTAAGGAGLAAGNGYVDVSPRDGAVTLVSPAPLALARRETDLLVLGLDTAALESVGVEARSPSGAWIALAPPRGAAGLTTTSAGLSVPLSWPGRLAVADQIRITLRLRGSAPTRIRHIALYPPTAAPKEPLNKSHMSRVSGAMVSDARRRGAANSSCLFASRATTQMSAIAPKPEGTGLSGRSALSRRSPVGPATGVASLRASHPGKPPSRPRGTYSEVP
jgi:hypothetical protein